MVNLFGRVTLVSALSVIRVPHPVHSVLCLIASFVSACALMILRGVEFLGLIFVVVYVGAIAVLFLFVVMMLNLNATSQRQTRETSRLDRWASLRLIVSVMELAVRSAMGLEASSSGERTFWNLGGQPYVMWVERMDPRTTMETLGQVLYTHKFIYLLMAGFVLLVARVGAVVLTLKVRTFALSKRQQVHQQRSRDSDRALMMTRVGS